MTLRYVYGQDRNVARFVASLIPHVDPRGFPANAEAIGVVDAHNTPLAGIVYFNWNPAAGTIEIAIAAARSDRHWFSRETIYRLFDHAFRTRGCQMAIMRVRADNARMQRQLDILGCSFAPVARLYGRAVDGVICTYTAEQWAESRFNRPPEAEIDRKVA
jgi:RimJ/RimL family protein N-acetyltransferase